MSLRAMIWAWDQEVQSATTKLILLKLADNTNDETGGCHPKISTIAKHCGCHRRTVERSIKMLQKMGLLAVINQYNDRRQINNRYRLNLQNNPQNNEQKTNNLGPAQSRTGAAQSPLRPGTESHQEPVSITTKSIKKKNAKNKILCTEKKPAWLPQKILSDFIEHRRQIKKPLTQIGLERLLTKLDTIRQQGGDPVEAINNSILSGYQGVFSHQTNKNTQGSAHERNQGSYQTLKDSNAKNMRYIEQLDREIAELDKQNETRETH